jgi:glycerol kinase
LYIQAHLVRAALEANAFQTVDVAQAILADANTHKRLKLKSLRVDGGGTKNALTMQFLADLLNVPIVRPAVIETTAMGAAFVAGLAVGLWKDTDELKGLWKADTTWEPSMSAAQRKHLVSARCFVMLSILYGAPAPRGINAPL